MIDIKQLSKHFGKLKVLDTVNLTFNRGECIALIGPNGSGKTTLIKSILGMVVPSAGKIIFSGQNIAGRWDYRQNIGYMPQIGQYPYNMTIGGVIDMMKDIRRSSGDNLDQDLYVDFDLERMRDKRMGTLSGGTRQKVSAYLAFLFNPDVLILDEPTAGLDPLSTEILKNKIQKERLAGKLIIITSHVLSDLDDLVSEVVYMQDGQPIFHKSLVELKSETRTSKLSKAIAQVMSNKLSAASTQ